jgi:hypothetical protein
MGEHRAARSIVSAACGLVLLGPSGTAGCANLPQLTLTATQRLHSRGGGSFAASAWTLGAALGWSAAGVPAAAADERGPVVDRDRTAERAAPPCAFEALCGWERTARSEALLRAETALLEDGQP